MVKIKGLNGNLVFLFQSGTCEEYCTFLENHFIQNQALFNGSRVIFQGPGLTGLTHEEIARLQKLCLNHGMILANSQLPQKHSSPKHDLFIHRNLRSGQKVSSEGSVVVWGDVHESAEIIAGGDIIVLGKLHGLAHAGASGDTNSIIFALNLNPGQIRIGNRISRSPKDFSPRNYPEIAFCDEDGICIKEYNSRENLRV
ncbi:septum site-determining protein MinC [Syntrophomonas erecta]